MPEAPKSVRQPKRCDMIQKPVRASLTTYFSAVLTLHIQPRRYAQGWISPLILESFWQGKVLFSLFLFEDTVESLSLGKKMTTPRIYNYFLLWITNYFSCYIWNCCLQNLEATCSILLCSPQLQADIIPRKTLLLINNVFLCYSVPIITTDVISQVSLSVC